MPSFDEAPIRSCQECILFHCNGDLPENKDHADAIVSGFETTHEEGWTISANDLDDRPDWYADDRCEICGATGTQTSPTALILMKETHE